MAGAATAMAAAAAGVLTQVQLLCPPHVDAACSQLRLRYCCSSRPLSLSHSSQFVVVRLGETTPNSVLLVFAATMHSRIVEQSNVAWREHERSDLLKQSEMNSAVLWEAASAQSVVERLQPRLLRERPLAVTMLEPLCQCML